MPSKQSGRLVARVVKEEGEYLSEWNIYNIYLLRDRPADLAAYRAETARRRDAALPGLEPVWLL